jgi:extracellular matrix regulatory protein A
MSSRVIAIVASGAAPMKRLRDEATRRGKLVDATQGRRTRSIILMDDDHVILSAISPETIASRFVAEETEAGEALEA